MLQSDSQALSSKPEDQTAPLFSRLDQLEDFRREDGTFHFKVVYSELAGSNEWSQTSNPATETQIEGYQAVRLDYPTNGDRKPWAGLGLCAEHFGRTLICDSPAAKYWWMCIGCQDWFPENSNQTIPGPWQIFVKTVQLYVEKKVEKVESCNSNDNGHIYIGAFLKLIKNNICLKLFHI